MKGFPPELIYVLVFVGILLLRSLMKRRGSEAPQGPAPEAGFPQALHETREDMAVPGRYALEMPSMPVPAEPPRRPQESVSRHTRRRRRFERQTLMGTRRDVQNAVVIAAILGPCRALEFPDRPVVEMGRCESAFPGHPVNRPDARAN